MKRIGWVCVCGCLLISLAGCSKKQDAPKTVKACDLLPQQEVQVIFSRVTKVDTAGGTAEKCCADVQGMTLCALISRGIAGLSPRDKFQLHLAEMTGKYPGQPINPESVDGIGDTAAWVANVGEFFVFEGNVLLRLTANPPENAKLEQMKKLAQKSLPRLPQ